MTGTATGRVIQADGRSKAYRPLPVTQRRIAVRTGLDAYAAGDYFLAHELLEPAWMGTADQNERALIQGLIKLAAADVHSVRGNPRGVVRNLEGALERIRLAANAADPASEPSAVPDDLVLGTLLADVERRLARARRGDRTDPITLVWER